jgi:hypothetical protein
MGWRERGDYIDDLKTLFEKLISFFWEVMFNPIHRSPIGLINMNSLSRATGDGCPVAEIDRGTTDCVVEDKYSICSSAVVVRLKIQDLSGIVGWYLRVFQKLFDFCVILCLNFLFIHKVFLFAFVLYNLESVAIESVFIFVSRDIVDGYFLGDVWACILI